MTSIFFFQPQIPKQILVSFRNPDESFVSWIRIPETNRTIQAMMKLLSQPIIQPSGIIFFGHCMIQQHFLLAFVENSKLLPGYSFQTTHFFLCWFYCRSCLAAGQSRWVCWKHNISVLPNIMWLIFSFTRPMRNRGEKCKHLSITNIGDHPGSFMEPRLKLNTTIITHTGCSGGLLALFTYSSPKEGVQWSSQLCFFHVRFLLISSQIE